jgi:hypothetical protein
VALGCDAAWKSYVEDFVEAGWQPGHPASALGLWSLETGALLEVLPIPLWSDAEGTAFLSCQDFGAATPEDRGRSAALRDRPAPRVTHTWIVHPGGEQRWLRVDSAGGTPGPAGPRPWLPSPDPCRTFPHHLRDMQGAELGYSTCLLLADGRVMAGGTTYGSSGTLYVRDGLQDLPVIHPGRQSVNFEILGETAPGELATSERMGPDSVDIYRFRV